MTLRVVGLTSRAVPVTNRPLTVAALLLAMFMSAMEATVVGTAMPTVIADLGGIGLYGWVGAAYLLAATVSVPVYGKLADVYGRKPLLLLGIGVFLLGSIGCGFAGDIHQLILWRTLQGLGAGATQPVALTVIGDLYDVHERGRVQGLFGAVWGVAGVAGPLAGGLIVEQLSWRWVFWVNVPVGVAAAAMLLRGLHEAREEARREPLDVLGAALLAAASLSWLLSASDVRPWLTAPLGAALVAGFVMVERRAADPVMPLQLISRREIAVASVSSVLMGAAMMGAINFVPLHLQGVYGASPMAAGTVVAPILVGWPIAATLVSRVVLRVGFRAPVQLGSVVALAALLGFTLELRGHVGMGWLRAAMFCFGVGMGLTTTALVIAIQSSVGFRQRGVATATNMFARNMGSALGMGALGAIFALGLRGALPPERVSELLSPELRGRSAAVSGRLAGLLEGAMQPVMWTIVGLAAVNLLVVAFYPRAGQTPAVAAARVPAVAQLGDHG